MLDARSGYTCVPDDVIGAEKSYIGGIWDDATRGLKDLEALGGLALSGGGVRSASFAFGVMQALASAEASAVERTAAGSPSVLQRLHYLSTVSGGGFAGAALTRLMKDPGSGFDLAEKFPFRSGLHEDSRLNIVRHRASYLDAGAGAATLNAIAVVLRTVFLTSFIYLLGLSAVIAFIHPLFLGPKLHQFRIWNFSPNLALVIAAALLAALLLMWLFYSVLSRFKNILSIASRRWFEKWGGWLAFAALMCAALGALGYLPKVADVNLSQFYSATILAGLVGLGSFGAFLGQFTKLFGGLSDKRWAPAIFIWACGLILIAAMLIGAREIALAWTDAGDVDTFRLPPGYWVWWPILLMLFFFFGLLANLNYVGLHRFYRDRLMDTFLASTKHPAEDSDIDSLELDKFCKNPQGLYHLINANVVLVNSPVPKYRGRGGDSYILSPLFTGSSATGWIATSNAGEPGVAPGAGDGVTKLYNRVINPVTSISLASAMAASGAALNPSAGADGGGPTRAGMLPLILSLLGIRLGYWQPNPAAVRKAKRQFGVPDHVSPGLGYGVLQTGHREDSNWIELTDGGHFENMGLYELFRRRVKTIIVSDGSTDPEFSMSGFASAYERARNDFGVEVDIARYPANFNDMMPDSARPHSHIKRYYKLAEHGFAIGVITYKDVLEPEKDDPVPGYIFYVNTVLTENLKSNLYSYKAEHPEFPDEPLSDQFFNEKQFDVYCQLGCELTGQMLDYARGYIELSGALGMKPRMGAKHWEMVQDPPYMTPEQLLADRIDSVGEALKTLSGNKTLTQIASLFKS